MLLRFGILIFSIGVHVVHVFVNGLIRVLHGHIPHNRAEGMIMESLPAQTIASRKHAGHILWIIHVHSRVIRLLSCDFLIG